MTEPMALDAKALEAARKAAQSMFLKIKEDGRTSMSPLMAATDAAILAYLAALPPPAAGEGLELLEPLAKEQLATMLAEPDQAFDAWRNRMPDAYWARYDLSAAKLGWMAGRAAIAAEEGLEPVAVKPKRLEWVSMMGGEKWQAFSVVGLYVVYRGQWWRGEPDIWVDGTEHRDNESAKAAVQDDFDERIRSALAATPASRAAVLEPSGVSDEIVKLVRDAFREGMDRADKPWEPGVTAWDQSKARITLNALISAASPLHAADMRGERYRCDVCGYSYYLDYEDMK